MPIRFRCAYCNQLLGISTRKAGTVVKCPTCAGQVVVPGAESSSAVQNPSSLVFERADFPELLSSDEPQVAPHTQQEAEQGQAEASSAIVSAPPPGSWGTHAEPPYDVEKIHPTPAVVTAEPIGARTGLFLAPRQLKVLAILAALLVVMAFAAGMLASYLLLR
jgi:phage FluMu protein Com